MEDEARIRDMPDQLALLLIPAFAWACFGRIVGLVLLWKMWESIQVGDVARTTPDKAVVLLLLPVYNLYWMFQAYWGWTKDFNRLAQSRYVRVQPMPEEIALLACMMALVPILAVLLFSGLPNPALSLILWWLATMFEMALTTYLFWRACDGINAVACLAGRDTWCSPRLFVALDEVSTFEYRQGRPLLSEPSPHPQHESDDQHFEGRPLLSEPSPYPQHESDDQHFQHMRERRRLRGESCG